MGALGLFRFKYTILQVYEFFYKDKIDRSVQEKYNSSALQWSYIFPALTHRDGHIAVVSLRWKSFLLERWYHHCLIHIMRISAARNMVFVLKQACGSGLDIKHEMNVHPCLLNQHLPARVVTYSTTTDPYSWFMWDVPYIYVPLYLTHPDF